MNVFFSFSVILSILVYFINIPDLPDVSIVNDMLDAAKVSVEVALGLAGPMALFVGILKIGEGCGLVKALSNLLHPLLVRLFPSVPKEHPAMGAMVMNFSANVLGLGNAATPFGIKAMQELALLNPIKDTASNAMTLFIAINTANITLIPTSVIALRNAAGSLDSSIVITTTLFASMVSTITAIITAKILTREKITLDMPFVFTGLGIGIFMAIMLRFGSKVNNFILPAFIFTIFAIAAWRKIKVYECFISGAKDGFLVIFNILPYLLGILFSFRLLRTSGIFDRIISVLAPYTTPLGLPAEALPMVLMRPFSGSGAKGVLVELLQNPAIGPDSYTGVLVSTMMGSTETTFYVLAVYCGAVGIVKMRYALLAAVSADIASVIGSVIAVKFVFNN